MTEPATAATCHCGRPIVPEDGFDLCRVCKFSSCPQCGPDTEYERGRAAGYAAAIKETQAQFLPLWQAVQQAVARSHALDSFIIEKRRESDG